MGKRLPIAKTRCVQGGHCSLHDAEIKLLNYLRETQFGSMVLKWQDGLPVHMSCIRQNIAIMVESGDKSEQGDGHGQGD